MAVVDALPRALSSSVEAAELRTDGTICHTINKGTSDMSQRQKTDANQNAQTFLFNVEFYTNSR